MFDAVVQPASETTSTVFDAGSFAAFIAEGVSSYGLSRHGNSAHPRRPTQNGRRLRAF